jgi:hypothetical protein
MHVTWGGGEDPLPQVHNTTSMSYTFGYIGTPVQRRRERHAYVRSLRLRLLPHHSLPSHRTCACILVHLSPRPSSASFDVTLGTHAHLDRRLYTSSCSTGTTVPLSFAAYARTTTTAHTHASLCCSPTRHRIVRGRSTCRAIICSADAGPRRLRLGRLRGPTGARIIININHAIDENYLLMT